MADQMSKVGWKVASKDFFSLGEQDFYPLLSKYVELGVDLCFVVGESPVAEAFLKQAREVGLKALIIMDSLSYIADWYKTTGEAGDYVLELGSPPWSSDASKAVAQKMKDVYGYDASPVSTGMLYSVTKCFIKLAERTLEKYGELNSETLYKTSVEELYTGKLTCDCIMDMTWKWVPETMPDLMVGEGYFTFPLAQYFGGKPVYLWPEAVRKADLKVPAWMQ
jgi:branched-chain amino acid transport system substrate-binding protein